MRALRSAGFPIANRGDRPANTVKAVCEWGEEACQVAKAERLKIAVYIMEEPHAVWESLRYVSAARGMHM